MELCYGGPSKLIQTSQTEKRSDRAIAFRMDNIIIDSRDGWFPQWERERTSCLLRLPTVLSPINIHS